MSVPADSWLWRYRASTRLAFILRIATMVASAGTALVWTRLLLGAMGAELYGLFLAFSGLMRFAGMGDLGIGGAVSLRTGQLLGTGRVAELREFLASARGLFITLAIVVGVVLLALTPWLPGWLAFESVPGAGSLTLLFLVGVGCAVATVLSGYILNVNYALGTLVWPMVPTFLLMQAVQFVHWQLARASQPLWIQFSPQLVGVTVTAALVWLFLRMAHPWLGELWPIHFDLSQWRSLLTASGWVYLCSLGNIVFNITDRLMVNAGFGAAAVTPYQLNYKLPELGLLMLLTASYVAVPKVTQWLAATSIEDRARGRTEAHRLNAFQSLIGAAVALGYFGINEVFVRAWLGPGYECSISLMIAFGCTLAVTAGGDAAIQLCGRCGDDGLRRAGLGIGGTALINLALSWLAMRSGWIEGIAWATVVAQTLLAILLARVVSRYLGDSLWKWTRDGVLLPLVLVAVGGWLRIKLPGNDAPTLAKLSVLYLVLLVAGARAWGFTPAKVTHELSALRELFRR